MRGIKYSLRDYNNKDQEFDEALDQIMGGKQ